MSPRTRERAADALAICASTPSVATYSPWIGLTYQEHRIADDVFRFVCRGLNHNGRSTPLSEIYAEAEAVLRMGGEP
jgi:hypothetical protein